MAHWGGRPARAAVKHVGRAKRRELGDELAQWIEQTRVLHRGVGDLSRDALEQAGLERGLPDRRPEYRRQDDAKFAKVLRKTLEAHDAWQCDFAELPAEGRTLAAGKGLDAEFVHAAFEARWTVGVATSRERIDEIERLIAEAHRLRKRLVEIDKLVTGG